MPRRRIRAGVSPYKPGAVAELAAIETRRVAAGVAVSTLADRAGIPGRTMRRIRASGRAWPREVRALRQALRHLEAERKAALTLFPEAP